MSSTMYLERNYLARAAEMEQLELDQQMSEELSFNEFLLEKASHYVPYEFKVERVDQVNFIAYITEDSMDVDRTRFDKMDPSSVVGISDFSMISPAIIKFRSALDQISLHQNLSIAFIPESALQPF